MMYGRYSVLHTFSIKEKSSDVFFFLQKFPIFAYHSAFFPKLYVTELVKPVGKNWLAATSIDTKHDKT